MARRGRSRQAVRPGGVRTQRYPEFAPGDRGETTDRLEARRGAESDRLDACDQVDAAIDPDDEALPQRPRLRTHGDLVYEVALSVEIGRRLEGRVDFPRRSHPSIWVADSRLFGFRDPLPDRRARALEADGALRAHRLRDGFEELPRIGPDAFARIVEGACDRRDLGDVGGLTVAAAQAVGRVRCGPPLDAVFVASGTDPVLLSAAGALLRQASGRSRLGEHLDRAAQAVALRHVDLCVRDPYRAGVVERRWAAEREGLGLEALDPGGANFGAWFGRTRAVAEVHYAVGLDPVRDPLPRAAVEAVLACGGPLPRRGPGGRRRRPRLLPRRPRRAGGVRRRPAPGRVDDRRPRDGLWSDGSHPGARRVVVAVGGPRRGARAAPDRGGAGVGARASRPRRSRSRRPRRRTCTWTAARSRAPAGRRAGRGACRCPPRRPSPCTRGAVGRVWMPTSCSKRRRPCTSAAPSGRGSRAWWFRPGAAAGSVRSIRRRRSGSRRRAGTAAWRRSTRPWSGLACALGSIRRRRPPTGSPRTCSRSPRTRRRVRPMRPRWRSGWPPRRGIRRARAAGTPAPRAGRWAGPGSSSVAISRPRRSSAPSGLPTSRRGGRRFRRRRARCSCATARTSAGDADRMSSLVIARGRGIELDHGYRSAWRAVGAAPEPPVVPVAPVVPVPPAAPERSR